MNGAVKHGPTKDESFIGVRKTIVILQHFVSTLDMLKYNYEASSFMHMVCDESWYQTGIGSGRS